MTVHVRRLTVAHTAHRCDVITVVIVMNESGKALHREYIYMYRFTLMCASLILIDLLTKASFLKMRCT